ncbi:MAG TPA: glycosyltransferase [Polyangia bacterium]|nr:glycosyltransferase [Polyangia bacterium]
MAEPAVVTGGASRPALLIVHVDPPQAAGGADAVYRTVQPCRALGELPEIAVISGSILSPELYRPVPGAAPGVDLLTAADILIIRDAAVPDLFPVVAARRREGRLTVFEPGARLFARGATNAGGDLAARSLAPQLARLADGVQIGGFGLDAQLEAVNARRARFPSQLWEKPQPETRERGADLVIGWTGDGGEREDLAVALPALGRILARHPQVRLSVRGGREIGEVVAALPSERVTLVPAAATDGASLASFLGGLDIGLVPLAPSSRERFVSDVRALEYAAHGVLVVASDAEPFRELIRPGQTGLLFREPEDLEHALEQTLADPDLRATMIAGAAAAAGERLERPHAAHRLGFYLSLAAQCGIRWGSRGGQAGAALLDAAGAAVRFPGSRYAALGSGEVEQLLVEGARRRDAGDLAEATRAFAEAERLAPDSHLPPLLLGGVLSDHVRAIDALARAEARRPGGCRAPYERGLRELARGDQGAAAASFERACAAAPSFGAPQERLGRLAEVAGRPADTVRLYEEAALQNPSFALPVARLAVQAQRRGETARAVALLERALAADPDLPLTHFLLGRAYLELGRLHQARAHLERAEADEPSGWPAHLSDGFSEAGDRAATMAALARAENRG